MSMYVYIIFIYYIYLYYIFIFNLFMYIYIFAYSSIYIFISKIPCSIVSRFVEASYLTFNAIQLTGCHENGIWVWGIIG